MTFTDIMTSLLIMVLALGLYIVNDRVNSLNNQIEQLKYLGGNNNG